ncbi:hypothetical protein [Parasphingorhabdus sp.]|uniref:hypothetical protein n=1 Tax=Parasphingorhabdus sp. TaxID=2709688 RepID=UPI003BAE7FE6
MKRTFGLLWPTLAAALLTGNNVSNPRLSFQGLGPIRIGMTVEQVKTLGFKLTTDGPWSNEEERFSCHYLDSAPDYPDIALMMNEDRLVRIDVSYGSDPGLWQSVSGARVGMSEQEVRAVYGDWLVSSAHPYANDSGSYLSLTSSDGTYAMIFETAVDGTRRETEDPKSQTKYVSNFRAGLKAAVGYIEGCA